MASTSPTAAGSRCHAFVAASTKRHRRPPEQNKKNARAGTARSSSSLAPARFRPHRRSPTTAVVAVIFTAVRRPRRRDTAAQVPKDDRPVPAVWVSIDPRHRASRTAGRRARRQHALVNTSTAQRQGHRRLNIPAAACLVTEPTTGCGHPPRRPLPRPGRRGLAPSSTGQMTVRRQDSLTFRGGPTTRTSRTIAAAAQSDLGGGVSPVRTTRLATRAAWSASLVVAAQRETTSWPPSTPKPVGGLVSAGRALRSSISSSWRADSSLVILAVSDEQKRRAAHHVFGDRHP